MNCAAAAGALLLLSSWFLPSSAFAVHVATVSQLENAVNNANLGGDKEILIESGTYLLNGVYLRLTADAITISGMTGNRADVILDGEYETTEIFQVLGSSVTIKDMTLKRAKYHPIHVFPDNSDVVGTLINNVHIIDPGQQAIKINQNGAKTLSADFGTVKNSLIELTASGRDMVWQINGSCYTGGVDGHHAAGWRIADNEIRGFWCSGGLSEHGVHFWSFSEDSLVERNRIINCDRGVGFGLGSSGHIGGIIRNNMIFHDSGHTYSDVGISLESAGGAQVYNNTIFHQHSYANAIEYRFSATSDVFIANNLTNKAISSREGGTAMLSRNITSAQSSWFKNVSSGDLHLAQPVSSVVDRGAAVAGLADDYDRQKRPMGRGIDIGADEYLVPDHGTAVISSWLGLLLDEL